MIEHDKLLNLLANRWKDRAWSLSYPNDDEIIIRSRNRGNGIRVSKYIIENIKIEDIESDVNKYLKLVE